LTAYYQVVLYPELGDRYLYQRLLSCYQREVVVLTELLTL